jgi:hypothetical protein
MLPTHEPTSKAPPLRTMAMFSMVLSMGLFSVIPMPPVMIKASPPKVPTADKALIMWFTVEGQDGFMFASISAPFFSADGIEDFSSLDISLSSRSEPEMLLAVLTKESSSLWLVDGRFKRSSRVEVEKCVDIQFPFEVEYVKQIIERLVTMDKTKTAYRDSSES